MYEYYAIYPDTPSLMTDKLDRLAKDGWRVVGVSQALVILEREVVECRRNQETGELVPVK